MRTILIHSGGLDSTVLLYHLMSRGDDVKCVSFDYGQRHGRELEAAETTCSRLLVPRESVRLPFLGKVKSSQTQGLEVPEGHYAAEGMKLTVVPNRNMIMLACAAAICIDEGYKGLATAVHAGDHDVYPDCRSAFMAEMRKAFHLCDWKDVTLDTPFIEWSKAEIVQRGVELHVPFEDTWSCYRGEAKACGKCGTCVERLEAFELAGAKDPLEYEDRKWWRSAAKQAKTS